MLRTTTIITSAIAISAATAAAELPVAPPVDYVSAPSGHKVEVEGTSNVHDWSSESSKITGGLSVPGRWRQTEQGLRLEPDPASVTKLEVRIAVRSLKSSRGNGLDQKLYDAMNAKKYPEVHFVLDSVKPHQSSGSSSTITWQASGQMTIAGTTKPTDLELVVTPRPDGSLKIEVNKPLKMTTFGIKPPTAMMGMARSADPVTVRATWIVRPQVAEVVTPVASAPASHREQLGQLLDSYSRAQHALAQNHWPQARQALAELATAADEVAKLDADEFQEPARASWQTAAANLRATADQAQKAGSINSARAPFAATSEALAAAIKLAGFNHDATVTAYRMPQSRGASNPIWLHVNADAKQKDLPVQSPYGAAANTAPEPVAIYLPARVDSE